MEREKLPEEAIDTPILTLFPSRPLHANACLSILSHLTLHLLQQSLEFLHIPLLLRPRNAQTFLVVRFRDDVEVHVVDFLVREPAVVLQDVVVFAVERAGDPARDGQEFGEGVRGDVG